MQTKRITSNVPDLSGVWTADWGEGNVPVQSVSPSDIGARRRGKEVDIPYQEWARQKTMSEKPPTGPDGDFEHTTDPAINYCEPLGVPRIYTYPARTNFVQTPTAVYILHEVGPTLRVIRLNSKHPADPDPQWWGDSIGSYEDGALVVDTVGFNDKTWLDQAGHPHTEKLHLVERYKRVDQNTLALDMTIEDPDAYTKPFPSHRGFKISSAPFLGYQWACSTRENQHFRDNLVSPVKK
jgi:hypothetical protein